MKKILVLLTALFPACLFAQTTITCDSILQTSTCAGGNVIIPFQTTGTFPWGNTFTAELSDNWGNWGNPVAMGSTMIVIGGNGIIFGNIPINTNFGFLYRVRIVSSNPADTSSDSPNTLIVTQVALLNQIVSNPGDSACPGDTITLYALNPASSYLWSTGDTTSSIQVTQSGAYSVTTTDALTCESTAHDTVVFDPSLCTGISELDMQNALMVYPNPAQQIVYVEYELAYDDEAYFEIKDISGRTVERRNCNASSSTQTIDIRDFSPGLYAITFYNEGRCVTKKLVVE